MTDRPRPDRRRFLKQGLVVAGSALLVGCDRLSASPGFVGLLDSAESLNRHLQRLLLRRSSLAAEFTEADISPRFRANGTRNPTNPEYRMLAANGFRDWRLEVRGLVQHPLNLSLDDIRALPARTQITRHDCVEGWSCIGKWTGARLGPLLERADPLPEARYVVFHCFDSLYGGADKYYESIDFVDAYHPQTILAYEMNGQTLTIPHGAPLRLRVERQLGYKMAKYLKVVEVAADLQTIGGGKGGYWEDRGYAWYAGI